MQLVDGITLASATFVVATLIILGVAGMPEKNKFQTKFGLWPLFLLGVSIMVGVTTLTAAVLWFAAPSDSLVRVALIGLWVQFLLMTMPIALFVVSPRK